MNLRNYYEEKVRIIDIDGKAWEGFVSWYFYPDENDDGEESIALDLGNDNNLIHFNKKSIKSIEIVDDR